MFENIKEYFRLDKLKEGFLYEIYARNGGVGVFHIVRDDNGLGVSNEFILSRFKFSLNYLFSEVFWDDGEPFGTVKPIRELEEVPKDILDNEVLLLGYLNTWEDKLREEQLRKNREV